MSSNVQQLTSSSVVMCQARSAKRSVSSNVIQFRVRNVQQSMTLSAVVVVEEEGDLVPLGVAGLVLQVVAVLDHPEAVDLDLEEVMVDLALLEDMEEVDLLQEEVMEQKGGKDGPLTLLEEVQADMEVDLGITAEDIAAVVEVLEEVVEGMAEVAEDLVEVVGDLAEVVLHLEEVRCFDHFTWW
jgi:hypothetical protein